MFCFVFCDHFLFIFFFLHTHSCHSHVDKAPSVSPITQTAQQLSLGRSNSNARRKKKIPSSRVCYTSTRRVFWQGHGQSVLQHGQALHVSFHCSGLFFLLMECEVCVKLSVSVWLPQRGQGVMRSGLWPCDAARWRRPYGVGEGALKRGVTTDV